jgi:hypothetical protein
MHENRPSRKSVLCLPSDDATLHRFHAKMLRCSASTIFPGRVASIKDVTELLIVVGEWLQNLSDVFRRQLVGLDAIGQHNDSHRARWP